MELVTIKENNTHYHRVDANWVLHLADSSLIMGHRLSEWTGHGPVLEQDIALTNISLDLIGQARNFYQYAAKLLSEDEARPVTEDQLAFLRDAAEYKNHLITELPNGHWGFTVLKVFLFSSWQSVYYTSLLSNSDNSIAAIAEKSLKEVQYHTRWSGDWVIRLGDGTHDSHSRMESALEELWPYTGEFFEPAGFEPAAMDMVIQKNDWLQNVNAVLDEATLKLPPADVWMHSGGKTGRHTEHLGYLLAEMQFLQRAYPGCEW